MKLVSVDRALKELQNDILFSSMLFSTGAVPSKMGLNTFKSFDAPSRDMCGWSMHTEM